MKSRMTQVAYLSAGAFLLALISILPAKAADDAAEYRRQALALNEITGNDTIKGRIMELLENKEGTKKLLAEAQKMAREKDPPFNYNAANMLCIVAIQMKDYEAGQAFFRICADKAAKLRSAQKLGWVVTVIDILSLTGRYEESAKFSQEFLEVIDRHGFSAELKADIYRGMIKALAKQGKIEEAKKLLDTLEKGQKADWRNLEVRAFVQNEAGQSEEAAKSYEELIERVAKDESLKKSEKTKEVDRTHYILSGIYVDLKQIDKATEHLKYLLSKKPDHPTYNNDLGYIWADHDMNLEEAEQMIRKAIEGDRKQRKKNPDLTADEDKDSAAFLDSLGWVLFKQKKFKEAKVELLKAVQDKDEGQHCEIYDHLGDVHMALGEKAEAIAAWKKAVEVAGATRREKDRKAKVEKKLKDNK